MEHCAAGKARGRGAVFLPALQRWKQESVELMFEGHVALEAGHWHLERAETGWQASLLRGGRARYRIIFELDRNRQPSANTAQEPRSWLLMKAALTEAIQAGVLHGDPNVVGHLIWSRLHGMVALHLAGMLNLGLDLESLVDAFIADELGSRLATGA